MKIFYNKYKGRGIVWIYCWNKREMKANYWAQICIGGQYLIQPDSLVTIGGGN